MRILLIGGGKSGKSTMAQRLAAALSGDAPRYYWATMTPHARIHRHVADRAGMDFITVERSFDLPAALPALDRHGTVLFDSVTACLSEQMFPGPAPDADAANRVLRELLDISCSQPVVHIFGRACSPFGVVLSEGYLSDSRIVPQHTIAEI